MNNKIVQIEINDNDEPLIAIPGDFLCVPMYFKQGLANGSSMKLREGLVEKLLKAKRQLPNGWDFMIWDGFRPLSVQDKLYKGLWDLRIEENPDWNEERLKEEVGKFVAHPSFDKTCPSPHNTGGAVDLTIVDRNGEELPMGTYFDEFHERSYGDYFDLKPGLEEERSGEFQKNRILLRGLLAEEGFAPYKWEWWHFSFGDRDWANHHGEEVAIYGSKEL